MINSGIYIGTITEVYEPGNPLNDSQDYQYLYEVVVATDKYAYLPVKSSRMDPLGGGLYNYDDVIFAVGQQVFLGFPFSDTSRAVILGGRRQEPDPQEVEGGIRWKRRFNEINQSISFNGVYQVQHSSLAFSNGPLIELSKDGILINDGGPSRQQGDPLAQFIEIDSVSNTININSGNWTLKAKTGVTINVLAGDVDINCLSANISAKKSVDVSTTIGTINISAGISCDITAKGKASVKAPILLLNSTGNPLDGVITTTTQPVCYITGLPFNGSKTVFAGP